MARSLLFTLVLASLSACAPDSVATDDDAHLPALDGGADAGLEDVLDAGSDSGATDVDLEDVLDAGSDSGTAGPDATTCPSGDPDRGRADDPIVGDSPRLPDSFVLGAGGSSTQLEGAGEHSDWYHWEREPDRVIGGDVSTDGPSSIAHYTEELDLLRDAGLGAYRVGIDWSRLFPTRARWDALDPDPAALAHYEALIDAIVARGLAPIVTLHHFVSPDWWIDVSAPREERAEMGFGSPTGPEDFARWAGFAASVFGDRVDMWITINEPFVVIQGAYTLSEQPPAVGYDVVAGTRAYVGMMRAHARAYDAISAADTIDADGDGDPTVISFTEATRIYFPSDPCNVHDRMAVQRYIYLNMRVFLAAVVRGDLDANLDGDLDDATDVRNDPTLRGRADFVSVNYYTYNLVQGFSFGQGTGYLPGYPRGPEPGAPHPRTEVGWATYPTGLRMAIEEASQWGLPMWVLENGIADGADVQRPRYLLEHVHVVAQAIADGHDVRGYLYWAAIDNFEWASGFCPRFGLIAIDYESPTRTRTPRRSLDVMRTIATQRRVTQSMLDAEPPYPMGPAVSCERPI